MIEDMDGYVSNVLCRPTMLGDSIKIKGGEDWVSRRSVDSPSTRCPFN